MKQSIAAAILMCGVATTFAAATGVSAQPDRGAMEQVRFAGTTDAMDPAQQGVHDAVQSFVRGMTEADAQTIWVFASEEEQDAFGTEDAVYEAFADAFPALTQVSSVSFDGFTQEGDTPFVQLSFADADGNAYQASMGLWLDDAGDWKLISCEIKPVSDKIA